MFARVTNVTPHLLQLSEFTMQSHFLQCLSWGTECKPPSYFVHQRVNSVKPLSVVFAMEFLPTTFIRTM